MSSPQTVPTIGVFDYIYDETGVAVSSARVYVTLQYNQGVNTSPQVSVQPTRYSTETDTNGFWTLNLVPNPNVSPLGTTYMVSTPYNSYEISVPASAGPYQTTSILVMTPNSIPGVNPFVPGGLTVGGNVTVNGGTTLAGNMTIKGPRPWIDVTEPFYGADPTGTNDSSTAINNALTAASGVTQVLIPPGTYLVSNAISVPSNSVLNLSPSATLVQNTGTLMQNGSGPNTNITVTGGSVTLSANQTNNCVSMTWKKVTGLTLSGLKMAGVNGSNNNASLSVVDCVNVNINNLSLNVQNSTGSNNGLWISGGNSGVVNNCVIYSGDDALAISTANFLGATTDCFDWSISNCYLNSHRARMIDIGATQSAGNNNVYNITIENCTGVAGSGGNIAGECLAVESFVTTGTGTVHDILLSNVTVDGTNALQGAYVSGAFNVTYDRINILGPIDGGATSAEGLFVATTNSTGSAANSPATHDVTFSNCTGSSNSTNFGWLSVIPGNTVGAANGCSNIHFIGCTVSGTTSGRACVLQSANGTVQNCSVEACTVTGTGSTGIGLYVLGANTNTNHLILGNTFSGFSGGLREDTGGADFNLYQGNNVKGCTQPVQATAGNHSQYKSNTGLNPFGVLRGSIFPQPSVPASGTAYVNTTGLDGNVYLTCGAGVSISVVSINGASSLSANTTLTGVAVAASTTSPPVFVGAGGAITLTYAGGTPTWQWVGN